MIGKVILGIVGSVAVMVAIGSQLPDQPTSEIVKELVLIDHAKEDIRFRLKDPDSAIFGEARYTKDKRHICFQVNAKNGFGGYAGAELMCAIPRPLVEAAKPAPIQEYLYPKEPTPLVQDLGSPGWKGEKKSVRAIATWHAHRKDAYDAPTTKDPVYWADSTPIQYLGAPGWKGK
jgi:hypothetical protein